MTEKAAIPEQNEAFQQPEFPPPYQETPSQQPQYLHLHPQPQAQPQPITVQPGQRVLVVSPVGPVPSTLTCNLCSMQVTTSVVFRPSLRTHLAALLLCAIGCWPFACVPYCVESCNSVDHYCPNCRGYIGSYRN